MFQTLLDSHFVVSCRNMKRPTLEDASRVSREIPRYVDERVPFGKVSPRTKITSLTQLREGDHLMEESPLGYWHHFIVEKVRPNYVWRIHKTGDEQTGKRSLLAGDSAIKAEVVRDKFVLEPWAVVYRVEYPNVDVKGKVYSDRAVVRRARRRLGERNYNALLSNCEHFCVECKTGNTISYQVYDFFWSMARLVMIVLNGIFGITFFVICESTGLVANTTVVLIGLLLSFLIGLLQDILSIIFLVFRADRARTQGHVTPVDAERFKAKRVTPVVLGFVGGIGGAVLGYYHIPVPLFGYFTGAFFGNFVWQALGLMFGRWIATFL
ncbi:predicted protein [Nematostella vectensis]|uniref:LRAT domain-containing protein n=1 Tax=Nematostella vectensis TaxID=45351 RepID=A7SPK4_NEMVE|nr:uncharacterized protein LOC5505722 [Nematostella vectensis]EDO34369.1 predicted protein [Nematostella vectensis]|eukprot:XP_001626469.1 predicted protein [Nematostella vectensis]